MKKRNKKYRRQRTVPCHLLALCLLLTSFTGCGNAASKNEGINYIEAPDLQAKWIWGDFDEENDTWLMARKTFTLDNELTGEPIYADISCDSKYWLYVNGQTVVRDGNLKRGRRVDATFYDTVDLAPYLKKGENCIALRVWYWGNGNSLCYRPSEKAALYFQMFVEDKAIASDETWKVRRDEAFSNEHDKSNYRLGESDIYYIASNEIEGWETADYDEGLLKWKNATVLGTAGGEPWGELIPRDIPQFVDSDELSYENDSEMPWKKSGSYTTKKEETFSMKLPYNAQVYPMLDVEASKGKKIEITSDMREHPTGDSVMTTYVTASGRQSFETFGWMNGETISYKVPAGVTIYNLSYRETGYDTTLSGEFSCDDEFYNELWEKSVRSVYVNMRDTYMDCPTRERACWAGDMGLDVLVSMYSMDPSAMELYASSMRTILGNRTDMVLWTINPTMVSTELPCQMLMLIPSLNEYYMYTGDRSLIEEAYEPICRYLDCWVENEQGLYDNAIPVAYMPWGDSTEHVDYSALENAWLCGAFDAVSDMASYLGKEEDAQTYSAKRDALKEAYRNTLWTEAGYQTEGMDGPDERANAAAVISGIASEDQYDTIAKVFETYFYSTPLLEYYVERACCEMNRMDLCEMRIKKRYDCMINAPADQETSTLWEHFKYNEGTSNHGWAAGPLVIMNRYMAGIRPLEAGYSLYEIKPCMSSLNELTTSFETIHGTVRVALNREDDTTPLSMEICQPADVTCRVAWEKKFGEPNIVAEKTALAGEDDTYYYFDVMGEIVTVTSK